MRNQSGRVSSRFTYANVVSSLALVIAVGGSGAVVASAALPKNSVGSAQIKNGQVKTPDLGKKSVASGKIKPGAVKGTHLRNGSVGAADLSPTAMGVARAYVWTVTPSPPANTPVTANHQWAYNSSGGAITFTRTYVGNYIVTFAGQDMAAGNVQVSAYGNHAIRCGVRGWGDDKVHVRCHDSAGDRTDSSFTVAYFH